MDLRSSESDDPTEYGSPVAVDSHEMYQSRPFTPVSPNNGQFQNPYGSPYCETSYAAVNPQFPQSFPVTLTTVTAPLHQSVLPFPPYSQLSRNVRSTPCHHARYVLDDKPTRTASVNENMVCSNCGTKNTSAWRRSADGKSECNACNLFFRKNGRKRPPSMRRDTIARRYRLSRCDFCSMENNKGSRNVTQIQKAVARTRRNVKTPSRAAITPENTVQFSDTSEPQLSATQNFFMPNSGITHPLPTFFPSNIDYNYQTSGIMNYYERPLYNIMNVEEQPNPSEVEDQPSSPKQSENTVLGLPADLFSRHLFEADFDASLDVNQHVAADGGFNVPDHDSQNHLEEPYHCFTDYPVEPSIGKNDVNNNMQLGSHYGENYAIMRDGNSSDGFFDYPSTVHRPLFDVELVSATTSGSSLAGNFDIFNDGNNEENDENLLVFRSL